MRLTMRRVLLSFVVLLALAACSRHDALPQANEVEALGSRSVRVNVLLNTTPSPRVLAALGKYGKVHDVITSINAVVLQTQENKLRAIRALPYVVAANRDAERHIGPLATVTVEDFSDGLSTWNLDAINVTDAGQDRVGPFEEITGEGVYVAVLDTGLVRQWREYFPEERIATEYAKSFGGGGGERGKVSEQPNKWEHDVNSHGTHVTSTILGYSLGGTPINGVAPEATVIPVKVLNQNGSGWSSVVAAGISYIGDLKAGPLSDHPVVINMSLGGSVLDAVEKAAIDYAIAQGVIIVASGGNSGEAGMGYPGAYAPVISVAAAGWVGQWLSGPWWLGDVPEPTDTDDFYIADFSSRQLAGQELDVTAPGYWVVGPYNVNQGKTSYYYLSGTSMASPHVAGIAALMAQVDGSLTQTQAETILKNTALPMDAGCRDIVQPWGPEETCWGDDATGSGFVEALGAVEAAE